ncbi:MAG: LacI family DNA-binding transcriptional regulator [Negativicutes bacterium]|nr:LacI family DNA-binding transcriptional regulator [Negativicutes bacterium]
MDITINSIAKLAGVSRTTVSRVLNNKPDVNKETREKVLEVIKEYDFYPSVFATGNKTKKTNTLGLIIPYEYDSVFTNPFYAEVMRGILAEAAREGYFILNCSYRDNSEYISIFKQKRVAGFIIVSPSADNYDLFDRFNDVGIPYVATAKIPSAKSLNYVDVDNSHGAMLAVDHLVSLGHRRIAIITGPKFLVSHEDRLAGYKLGLIQNDLPYQSQYIKFGDNSIESGFTAAKELLVLEEKPTAFFAAADMMAIGVIKALQSEGYAVPGDVSVIGFDNIPMAEYIEPPLTTIGQPANRKGAEACRMLIQFLEDGYPVQKSILPVELKVRDTTGPVKQ